MRNTFRYLTQFAILVVLSLLLLFAVYQFLTLPTKEAGATWHNLTIGKSGPDDVIAELGAPSKVESQPLGTIYHYYADERAARFKWDAPMIIIQGGIVAQIVDNVTHRDEHLHLSDFVQKYGTPDYITWAYKPIGDRVVVFLDEGILLVTIVGPQPETTDVLQAYYFRPCSMMCVKLKFPFFTFGITPSETESDKTSSIFELEDPWGLTRDQ